MIERFKARLPWLFGSHYKIERFGVIFGVLCLLMALDVGLIVRKHANDQRMQVGNQVMYTTAFKMSMSGASAKVLSVNTSLDRTKCFVLLKWDDMKNVVADADKYSLFLTGCDYSGRRIKRADLESAPVASIYMFGSTGYMGIYLVDVNGFPSQILDLVIRSDNNFDSGNPIPDARGDSSFLKYDQARIYFNPGGASRQTIACLEDDDMTAFGIFESIITATKEEDIRVKMDEALLNMKNDLVRMEEYERRLDTDGIQLTDRPFLIYGDEIVESEDGILDLKTDVLLAGGYDFDWRNGSVRQGYIDKLVQDSPHTNYEQYLYGKSQEVNPVKWNSSVNWYRKDGTQFTVSTSVNQDTSSVGAAKRVQINNNIIGLQNLWEDFYKNKYAYQVTYPGQLLNLEITAKEMTSNYSVNAKDGLMRLY